jgi:hypothetical protein
MRIIENGSKIQVKSGYASGLTGKIVSSASYNKGKKIVYTIELSNPYNVPYRDNGIDSILLEKQDFIVYG